MVSTLACTQKGASTWASGMSVGSNADICGPQRHVRFTPDSDRKSGLLHKAMSALPPKADMCGATSDVRFGSKADMFHAKDNGRKSPNVETAVFDRHVLAVNVSP